MKKILTFLIVVSSITSCVKSIEDKNPIKVSVKITEKKTQTINRDGDTITTYPFKISIQNQTDSIFSFWKMSCSYWDSFEFNTEGIRFYSWGCTKNIYKLIELSPKEEYTIDGEFEISDIETIKKQENLRLSFVLVRKKEYSIFPITENSLHDIISAKRKRNKDMIMCDKPIKYDW